MKQTLFEILPGGAAAVYHPVVLLGLLTALACTLLLLQRRGRDWTAEAAWLRAFQYFGAACALSYLCGVWTVLFSQTPVSQAELASPLWCWLTAIWGIQVVAAYGFLWPMGTFSGDRPSRPIVSTAFGCCWGFCHTQVFLSIWALVELGNLHRWWLALISFALISAYNGNWHGRYWDRKVSPPHNLEEWNARKILFCHVPNLGLGITHLALFGNVAVFVAVQTLALMISAYVMRFPRWDYQPSAANPSK